MGQTCCSQKSVDNSQTLVKDENHTQPELERINSKQIQKKITKDIVINEQDLPGTDDTATKNGKSKNVEKQTSIQVKSNPIPTLENEKPEEAGSMIVKSKKEEKIKEKSSQLENALGNTSELKKGNHAAPVQEEQDNLSKKKSAEGGTQKDTTTSQQAPAMDLFMDLPGPPPNLREINRKSAPKVPSSFEREDNSD